MSAHDDRRQRRTRLRAARRRRRDRHEPRALRLRPGRATANGSSSISASPSPDADAARRRPRPARHRASSRSSVANLLGIVITHAHEDHYGALLDLWPRLKAPVYMTPFAAGLLAAKRAGRAERAENPGDDLSRRRHVHASARSRSSTSRSRIRSPSRCAGHPHAARHRHPHRRLEARPGAGRSARRPTRRASARSARRACWRWSAIPPTRMREGDRSPSEAEVGDELARASSPRRRGRVAVTTFASNVGRIRVDRRGRARAGREVRGRRPRAAARHRCRRRARLSGRPAGVPRRGGLRLSCRATRSWRMLTGSQGEPRAALAKLAARRASRRSRCRPATRVVFSSRTIPGNEKAVNRHHQRADRQRHRGHHRPRRAGPRLRPSAPRRAARDVRLDAAADRASRCTARPLHLAAQAIADARAAGVAEVAQVRNGDMMRLAPGPAEIIDEVAVGRLYKDGRLIGDRRGDGRPRPAQAGLRRPCRGQRRARRQAASMPDDPDIVADRRRREPMPSGEPLRGDRDGRGRSARSTALPRPRRTRSRGRAARRCGAPCAARSTRPGARSRWCTVFVTRS